MKKLLIINVIGIYACCILALAIGTGCQTKAVSLPMPMDAARKQRLCTIAEFEGVGGITITNTIAYIYQDGTLQFSWLERWNGGYSTTKGRLTQEMLGRIQKAISVHPEGNTQKATFMISRNNGTMHPRVPIEVMIVESYLVHSFRYHDWESKAGQDDYNYLLDVERMSKVKN